MTLLPPSLWLIDVRHLVLIGVIIGLLGGCGENSGDSTSPPADTNAVADLDTTRNDSVRADTAAQADGRAIEVAEHVVTACSVCSPRAVQGADLTGNGHTDVLTTSSTYPSASDEILWYENDGDTTFTRHTFSSQSNDLRRLHAADLNGDGHTDILSGSTDKIVWYENNGDPSFTAHRIDSTGTPVQSLSAADVNGDGHTDVLSAAGGRYGDSHIAWYENDGEMSFTKHRLVDADAAQSVSAADVDQDGNMDILSGYQIVKSVDHEPQIPPDVSAKARAKMKAREHYKSYGVIAVHRNNGDATFTRDTMTADTLRYMTGPDIPDDAGDRTILNSVSPADVNGDGHTDLVSAIQGNVTWYENDGDTTFTARSLTTEEVDVQRVHVTDLNGDEHSDLVAVGEGKISWFKNRNRLDSTFRSAQLLTRRSSSNNSRGFSSVYPVDINEDGSTDLLFADTKGDSVGWLENDSSESYTEHVIDESSYVRSPESIYAADLNGDGRTDLLSASSEDDKIAWYENRGQSSFVQHTIVSNADSAQSVSAADLNGDGQTDVLSASKMDSTVAWHENTGDATFTTHTITTEANGLESVQAVDLNGDRRPDVLACSENIVWYRNGGKGTFAAETVASESCLHAADVNGDGHTDILNGYGGASSIHHPGPNQPTFGRLVWYENSGGPSFMRHPSEPSTTHGMMRSAISGHPIRDIDVGDVDGDGDTDLLSSAYFGGKSADEIRSIVWHENEGDSTFTTRQTIAHDWVWEIHAANVNNDGWVDILSAERNRIALYENQGDSTFTPHTISSRVKDAKSVYAADLTGDGTIEVVSASQKHDKIAWYDIQ